VAFEEATARLAWQGDAAEPQGRGGN